MNLQPTVPGYMHGIISLDPPTVQCDGCGLTFTAQDLSTTVLTSGILFNPRNHEDRRRLCGDCARKVGWDIER